MRLEPELRRILTHQIALGAVKDGDVCYFKLASDGTNLTRKDVATVTTVTFANTIKALQVATIAIILTSESYEVKGLSLVAFL